MIAVRLGSRLLDRSSAAYVIAEVGVNHEGSLETAYQLIDAAKRAGADAVKFQTYKADLLAVRDSPAYWDRSKEPTATQHELFSKYDALGSADYVKLAAHCAQIGIDFTSTPFDLDAVDTLDPLVPYFKIASADITNIPLLRRVAKTRKPVVLSTGAATLDEISQAVSWIEGAGGGDVVLLHCVLSYPTADDGAHLRAIEKLASSFPKHMVGLSDHTVPDMMSAALITAFALGAVVLEKHFTLDRALQGNDHYHALDEVSLRETVQQLSRVHLMIGSDGEKHPTDDESSARIYARRSIVSRIDIAAGARLTEEMLICKRPGTGIGPDRWDDVVGSVAAESIPADTILTVEMLSGWAR